MSGETDLDRLLHGMSATLRPEIFVFATAQSIPEDMTPLMTFREAEGMTVIVAQEEALAAGLPCEFPCRMITLNIHSALEAVGFLARILPELAALDVGVNPVSAFHHDHLFVPADRADEVMDTLNALARDA